MTTTTEPTFKEAFETLKRNAQALRNATEPDIDTLLETVQSSITAKKICSERIDAVDKALTTAFASEAPDPAEAERARVRP